MKTLCFYDHLDIVLDNAFVRFFVYGVLLTRNESTEKIEKIAYGHKIKPLVAVLAETGKKKRRTTRRAPVYWDDKRREKLYRKPCKNVKIFLNHFGFQKLKRPTVVCVCGGGRKFIARLNYFSLSLSLNLTDSYQGRIQGGRAMGAIALAQIYLCICTHIDWRLKLIELKLKCNKRFFYLKLFFFFI